MYAEEAGRLSSRFNTPASPCEHCGSRVKAYRQHPSKCSVLWQISLMSLKMGTDRSGHGAAPGNVRAIGRGPAQRDGLGAKQEGSRAGLGPFRSEQSTADGAGQRTARIAGPLKQATLAQSWRKGAPRGWPPPDQHDQALARLALQQETALKILRQDYSWVLFVQPGNQGPVPLLFAAAQKWKKTLEKGRTTTALRTTLFGCLIQMLHTGLKDIGSEESTPFQKKAEEMKWLKDGHWCYQKWSPAPGSLVVDETKPPLPRTKLLEAVLARYRSSCSPT